jgi:hypothetical protein
MTMAAWIWGRGGGASGLPGGGASSLRPGGSPSSMVMVCGGLHRGGAVAVLDGNLYGDSSGTGVISWVTRLMMTG